MSGPCSGWSRAVVVHADPKLVPNGWGRRLGQVWPSVREINRNRPKTSPADRDPQLYHRMVASARPARECRSDVGILHRSRLQRIMTHIGRQLKFGGLPEIAPHSGLTFLIPVSPRTLVRHCGLFFSDVVPVPGEGDLCKPKVELRVNSVSLRVLRLELRYPTRAVWSRKSDVAQRSDEVETRVMFLTSRCFRHRRVAPHGSSGGSTLSP